MLEFVLLQRLLKNMCPIKTCLQIIAITSDSGFLTKIQVIQFVTILKYLNLSKLSKMGQYFVLISREQCTFVEN